MSHATLQGRLHVLASGQYREALFYNTPRLQAHAAIPRVLYSYASAFLGEFVILIEDVTLTRVVPVCVVTVPLLLT
jgi:hypothetical protein